jgi:2-C-methyl-D-erythritol 2,4-cyclodiphosphate synthase
MRVGQGYDAHRFQAGRRLVLGGVDIPYEMGMEAHSDGDVVIHALCDALLGAAAMGDIGKHFPDTDQSIKNIDSRLILRHIVSLLTQRGYRIGNVDATIIAQAPKMAPYIPAMCENLASDLQIAIDAVNVKATTTERMGFTGRGEGIAALAVATLLAP